MDLAKGRRKSRNRLAPPTSIWKDAKRTADRGSCIGWMLGPSFAATANRTSSHMHDPGASANRHIILFTIVGMMLAVNDNYVVTHGERQEVRS